MAYKIKNKKGQVTIWIILAIGIVVMIGLLFVVFNKDRPVVGESVDYENPEAFIEQCVRKAIGDAEEIIIGKGGVLETRNAVSYNNESVEYICKKIGNFEPCIQQHPSLLAEITNDLHDYSFPIIDSCFNSLKKELEKRNEIVEMSELELDVKVTSGKIQVDVFREFNVEGRTESRKYEKFETSLRSDLYLLATTALEIARDEAKSCYFEYVGYMALHPELKINKITLGDNTRIYGIEGVKSGQKMNIAIRGCAIPAGI